jgi:PAS domain S-box-containing protein
MFGWTETEAVGVRLADLLVPERFREAHVAGVHRQATAGADSPTTNHYSELSALHRDGHEMPVAVTVAHEPTANEWQMVGFVRDRSAESEARDALMRELSRRETVAASLARLHAGDTIQETADAICAEMMATLGLDVAAVDEFVGRGAKRRLVPLAVRGPVGVPISVGHPLPADRTRYLAERSTRGPWVDGFQSPDDATYLARWRSAGLHSSVYVPVGPAGAPFALLVGGSALSHDADALTRLLPYMLEYAAITEALIGSELTARQHAGEDRRRMEDVIRGKRFYPVFQPIFQLDGSVLVGYEALTRFDDGRAPDLVFAQAEAIGLGEEMEVATLEAAFAAGPDMSAGLSLSVNVSPGLIASGRLEDVLPTHRDRLILEVTEHAQISDYPAIRTAVDSLAPARLAVDDAGAGFASLRHIIELAPDFVKLDIGLVRGIDQDPVRQGMVAGIAYFVVRTGRSIIAEGIETKEELATLRSLGIEFGQGFLLGRPARFPGPDD